MLHMVSWQPTLFFLGHLVGTLPAHDLPMPFSGTCQQLHSGAKVFLLMGTNVMCRIHNNINNSILPVKKLPEHLFSLIDSLLLSTSVHTCLAAVVDCFVGCQQVQSKITCVPLPIALHSLFFIIILFFPEKPSIELKWWVQSFNFGASSKPHILTEKNSLETHSKYIVKVLTFIRHQ